MLSQPQQPGVHGSEGQQTAAEFLRQTDAPGEARPQVVQLHVSWVFVGFYLPAGFWWFSGSRVSFLWVVWSENLGKHFGKEQQLCYYVLSLLQLRSGDQRERFHFTRDRKKKKKEKKRKKTGGKIG